MSKTLEKLLNKALKTGYANLNGRMHSYGWEGELESRYCFEYDQETGDLTLSHWGTEILTIGSLKSSKPIVKEFYGQSKSDRDALCFVFDYLGMEYTAQYRPSIEEFSVTADFGTGELEKKNFQYE